MARSGHDSWGLCLALPAVFVLSLLQGQVAAQTRLKFRPSGIFKVVIFTDQHYGENAWDTWGPEQDARSTKVMNTILDVEKPDLVVYLGDQLTANNLLSSNASAYWDQVTAPCRRRRIPWAAVFGNHDAAPFEWEASWFGPEGIPKPYNIPQVVRFGGGQFPAAGSGSGSGSGRRLLAAMQTTSKFSQLQRARHFRQLSRTRSGPLSLWPAVGNYYLRLWASNGSAPAAFFYFLDSGGGDTPEVLSHAQGQWLNTSMHTINPKGRPEYLFVHIPLPAMAAIGPAAGAPIQKPCMGTISGDDVTPVTSDWGLIDILTSRKSFQASFSGHNHGNDWCCPHRSKLWLCFARHSGYGGYGSWVRGAKVLQFRETPFSLDTWIRFEDGSSMDLGPMPLLR